MNEPARIKATMEHLLAQGVEYCFATYIDVHGVPKAKTVPIASFAKMAMGSELFTVGAMEGMGLVGPQQDECAAVPDLDSLVILPWAPRFAWFASDLYFHGQPYANCARVILKKQLALAAAQGLTFNLGVEAEFYVFRRTAEGILPLSTLPFRGPTPAYDVHQTMQAMPFLDPMVKNLNALGWGVYSFDQEGGHGQVELDFAYADALITCDRLVFLRFMAKQIAASLGAVASFMPKPFAGDFRSGAHFNMSMAKDGKNLFDGSGALAAKYGIGFPDAAYHFIAGLLEHAPALTAITCPTHNSYKGLIAQGDMPDMSWAPVLRCYGRNNRSAMLRLPMNRPCVENRSPDIAANFHLSAALSLAAGMDGMARQADPGAPWNENLYELVEGRAAPAAGAMPPRLPRTLIEAVDAFAADPLVTESLGAEFRDIYIRQKTREWDQAFYRVSDEERERQLDYV